MKILIIHNPYSGNKKNIDLLKSKIKLIAQRKNCTIDFLLTKKRNDATEIIKQVDYYDLVISMGGDGTFNEIVKGNLERKEPLRLSHLPVGTTNDLRHSFGLTNNVVTSFNDILDGKDVSYDILSINNTPFTYTAGFGKFLNIPYETTKQDKMRLGYFAYIKNAIKDFFKNKIKLYDIEYELNGKKNSLRTPLVLISNSNHLAGMRFYKNVKLNDNLFEVLISQTKAIIPMAFGLLKIKMGFQSKSFKLIRTNDIKISVQNYDKNWCIDGEKLNDKSKKYEIKILKKICCRVSKNAKNFS